MIPALVLSKIYANSLLVVFNSRVNIIRGRIKAPEVTRIDALVFPKSHNSAVSHSHTVETGARTVGSALTVDISTSFISHRGMADHSRIVCTVLKNLSCRLNTPPDDQEWC